jgi:hypothetical protein
LNAITERAQEGQAAAPATAAPAPRRG